MSKCWIIEQGCYSDYRVVGIFTTKENAEQALAFLLSDGNNYHYNEPEIVERCLDPCIQGLNEGLTQFGVRITKDGTAVTVTHAIDAEDFHWTIGSYYNIWARNEAHAIKIASERHVQYLAEKTS